MARATEKEGPYGRNAEQKPRSFEMTQEVKKNRTLVNALAGNRHNWANSLRLLRVFGQFSAVLCHLGRYPARNTAIVGAGVKTVTSSCGRGKCGP